MPRIGIGLLTFADADLAEFVELGRYADRLGYDCVYTTESMTDTFAIDLAIALNTTRIDVGSFVALTTLRHPVITAQAAVTISDLSGGRFRLGLGLGHKPRNAALGVPTGRPQEDLRGYVEAVRALLAGRGRQHYPDLPQQRFQGRLLDFRTPRHPVPILTAAVGRRMAELGGEIADGLMLYLQPRRGVRELRDVAHAAARANGRGQAPPEIHMAVHAFVADDEELALDQARGALAYWAGLPAYNRRIAEVGFKEEAAEAAEALAAGDDTRLRAALSRELIDEFCVIGTPDHCRAQLETFVDSGADVVVVIGDPLYPGERYADAVCRTAEALQP